jgi:heme oxygenase (mycobilin-producing)
MTAKIMIKRSVPAAKKETFLALINRLRAEAIKQPGYMTGEAMQSIENADEYLVISTWNSIGEWESWKANAERKKIQKEIDTLLGSQTRYEAYQYLLA